MDWNEIGVENVGVNKDVIITSLFANTLCSSFSFHAISFSLHLWNKEDERSQAAFEENAAPLLTSAILRKIGMF